MVKSYIWTAEKISGLNLSGVGLKTTMISLGWCSTPSTTRATCGRILCKINNNDKQRNKTKNNQKMTTLKKLAKVAVWETFSPTKWWKIAHFGTAIQISKNTWNRNRITAGNKYVWTVETSFKYCAKKAPSCEKRVKLPIFSRRSCGLVVGNLLLLKNEYPQYLIRIKRAKLAHYLWTSLIFTRSGCSLPRKNRKSSKSKTFKSIAPAYHDSWRVQ